MRKWTCRAITGVFMLALALPGLWIDSALWQFGLSAVLVGVWEWVDTRYCCEEKG